jgi:hypothetical protein
MKKVALTVAVLTLGLAACQDNAPDNNTSTVNTVETEAAADVNSSLNAVDNGAAAADNALDNASNSIDNAQDAVDNSTTNTQ